MKRALEGGEPVRNLGWDGNLGCPGETLLKALQEALQVRLVLARGGYNGNGTYLFSSEETMLSLNLSEQGGYARAVLVTNSVEIVRKSEQIFTKALVPDNPEAGLIFSLAKTLHGFSIRRVGAAGAPLERGNYNDAVLKGYDHVVADLVSPSPCGRLTILSGAPGTGKTWLVRSMLAAAPKVAFVVVPPQLVAELGSPEILPALTDAKSEFGGPICLILEDADKVLVNRKDGDMSAISAMLNLGDGLLGAVLDVRILATTNAERLEMDPATRRVGRLCRYMQVDPLLPPTAAAVYQRLTQKPRAYQGPTSLAEVYSHARESGWVAPPIANPRPQMAPHLF